MKLLMDFLQVTFVPKLYATLAIGVVYQIVLFCINTQYIAYHLLQQSAQVNENTVKF